MKRVWLALLCLSAVAGLTAGSWLDAGAEDVQGKLIGTAKCKMCHKSAKRGNQYAVWEASGHAHAFATLASEEAQKVAAKKGIADPQKADECLTCHTTQGFLGQKVALDPKGKYDVAEGVGCEACHGPGSEYKSMKVMKDAAAAKAAGLVMPAKEHCLECHNEKSPTYQEFKFEERWAKIKHPKAPAE